MGVMTSLSHTAITIDPLLLDECVEIWWASKSPLPPSPYDIADFESSGRAQVVTWAQIKQYYLDEGERKRQGLA